MWSVLQHVVAKLGAARHIIRDRFDIVFFAAPFQVREQQVVVEPPVGVADRGAAFLAGLIDGVDAAFKQASCGLESGPGL